MDVVGQRGEDVEAFLPHTQAGDAELFRQRDGERVHAVPAVQVDEASKVAVIAGVGLEPDVAGIGTAGTQGDQELADVGTHVDHARLPRVVQQAR